MQEEQRRETPFAFDRRKPYVTWIIIGVTVAVFLVEMLLNATEDMRILVIMGAKYHPLITLGQYWRLLTPALLHGSIVHIAMNMISLYMWGPTIELLYGKWKMLAIYVMSAVMGTAFSYAISPALSVGASGAIFGLFGTILSFGRDNKAFFKKVFGSRFLILIGVNVAYGLMNTGIDIWAHLGGLVGGYLAAEILGTYKRPRTSWRMIASTAGYILVIMLILIRGKILNTGF